MSHAFAKSVFTCLVTTTVLLATRGATAQTTGAGGTIGTNLGTLNWKSDFTYYLQRYDAGEKNWIQMNATEQQFFFNRARCECVADQTNLSGSFRVAIQNAQTTSDKIRALLNQNLVGSGTVRLYAGSNIVNCLQPSSALSGTALASYCVNLLNPDDASAQRRGRHGDHRGRPRLVQPSHPGRMVVQRRHQPRLSRPRPPRATPPRSAPPPPRP